MGADLGARVIVEATLPDMNVEPSQGSHFFHNISSFRVGYFWRCTTTHRIRSTGQWLERQPAVAETDFVRHVRLPFELEVKVDGRRRRGVVLAGGPAAGRGPESET